MRPLPFTDKFNLANLHCSWIQKPDTAIAAVRTELPRMAVTWHEGQGLYLVVRRSPFAPLPPLTAIFKLKADSGFGLVGGAVVSGRAFARNFH